MMMKTYKFLACLIVSMLGFVSCSDDDNASNSSDGNNPNNVYVAFGDTASLTYEELGNLLFSADGLNGEDDSDSLLEAHKDMVEDLFDEYEAEEGENGFVADAAGTVGLWYATSGIKYMDFEYESIDADSNTIILSGLVSIGKDVYKGKKQAKSISLVPHYTEIRNNASPSYQVRKGSNINGDLCASSYNPLSVCIIPDYIGYGKTSDKDHPYLAHDLTARNCIDAMEAGWLAYLKLVGKDYETPNLPTIALGCSQGASAALAIHKVFEEDDALARKWNYQFCYVGSGAYDPALTIETYYKYNELSYPVVIPLTLRSMLITNKWLNNKYDEEDFFSEAYNKVKSKIDKAIKDKKTDAHNMGKYMHEVLYGKGGPLKGKEGKMGSEYVRLTDILSEDMLNTNSEIYKDLMKCLQANNLLNLNSWKVSPKREIRYNYTKRDVVVPPENSYALANAFGSMAKHTDKTKGLKWKVSSTRGHTGACRSFYLNMSANVPEFRK